jgi:hypothetical protein
MGLFCFVTLSGVRSLRRLQSSRVECIAGSISVLVLSGAIDPQTDSAGKTWTASGIFDIAVCQEDWCMCVSVTYSQSTLHTESWSGLLLDV